MSAGAGTLGKYQIIREIARSNDIVYEAYDPAMNRRVALKELAMPGGATEKQRAERKARFMREAKAAGSLAHPNIVTIYEVGEDNGRIFIAMEYLEGQNLRQRMDVEGALPQEEAVHIVMEVLEGLSYAHEKGVVHRDIKPDNIQLLPDKRVKITDFGIARLMFEPSLTMDGQIFGTPSYMSPEQVVGRDVDAHTDVWGCGVLLYEAIAGTKPFTGDSVVAISHAIMHVDPPDPPRASYSIAQVIRRALDKAPSQRFQSTKAMRQALKDSLDSLQTDPRVAPMYTQQPMGATYMPQTPWGPPLDPYAQTANPPPQTQPVLQPPPVYGQPYGQPYGQFTHGQQAPPPPYPLGWTQPPRRPPLLSPAASEFLRRTLIVIIVGGALLASGVLLVADLSSAGEKNQTAVYDKQETQNLLAKARDLRISIATQIEPSNRIATLLQAREELKKAENLAPDSESSRAVSEEQSRNAMALAREFYANLQTTDAEISAIEAVRFANASGNETLRMQAAQLQAEISPSH